jgi:hypothetical protein
VLQLYIPHNYYFLDDFYSFFFLQILFKPFLRNKINPMPLSCSWYTDPYYGLYRLLNLKLRLTSDLTGWHGMFSPPRHLIPPLVYAKAPRSLICISYRTYEIDEYWLYMPFQQHDFGPRPIVVVGLPDWVEHECKVFWLKDRRPIVWVQTLVQKKGLSRFRSTWRRNPSSLGVAARCLSPTCRLTVEPNGWYLVQALENRLCDQGRLPHESAYIPLQHSNTLLRLPLAWLRPLTKFLNFVRGEKKSL